MRSDKAPIIRVNLNKSDSELIEIAKLLGINKSDILNDKTKFKSIYFMLDNELQYREFAYIRKNSTRMEYTKSIDKYLNSLPDTDINSIQEIINDFNRINNNTKYLLGEKVDDPKAIQNEKHLEKLSIKMNNSNLNIDQILEKISKSGIKSLTALEKKFLEDFSKNI
jgi:hypothetical protein